jgi:hypothetical protein
MITQEIAMVGKKQIRTFSAFGRASIASRIRPRPMIQIADLAVVSGLHNSRQRRVDCICPNGISHEQNFFVQMIFLDVAENEVRHSIWVVHPGGSALNSDFEPDAEQESQSVCGIKFRSGLKLASQLPEPIFTPATNAVGLNGYRGPTLNLPGNTMLFGPNVTELLFGLVDPIGEGVPVDPGLYLTGLHFDLDLPDIEGVEITGLELHMDISLAPQWNQKFVVMSHVPEGGGSAVALLALGLVALTGYRYVAA